jgi:hypothetical protein
VKKTVHTQIKLPSTNAHRRRQTQRPWPAGFSRAGRARHRGGFLAANEWAFTLQPAAGAPTRVQGAARSTGACRPKIRLPTTRGVRGLRGRRKRRRRRKRRAGGGGGGDGAPTTRAPRPRPARLQPMPRRPRAIRQRAAWLVPATCTSYDKERENMGVSWWNETNETAFEALDQGEYDANKKRGLQT